MKKPEILKHFPDNYQGVASNVILAAIRGGAKNYQEVFNYLLSTENNHWVFLKLKEIFQGSDKLGKEAVDYYLKWETLTPEEKQNFRDADREYFVAKKMDKEPPTEKQIHWLKKYGVEIPDSKLKASKLLDEIFKK